MTDNRTVREVAELFTSSADPVVRDGLLSPDITWQLVGEPDVEYARLYQGKGSVYADYFAPLQAKLDPARTKIETHAVIVDEEAGSFVVHNHDSLGLADGSSLDVEVIMIAKVSAGQIVAVQEFMDLRPVVAGLGLSLTVDQPTT